MFPKIETVNDPYGNPKFSFVAIIVLTGSIFENEKEKGISHFIEHLIFKGSKYTKNMKNLNNKLNSQGMIVNAFTNQFVTVYHITAPTKYINQAITSLIQIVFNPIFRKSDIKNERKVVINELLQRTNSPENLASFKALQITYDKKNPLYFPVIGSVNTLLQITQEDIKNYYNKFYTPNNIIFFSFSSKNKNSIKKIWENEYKKYANLSIKNTQPINTSELLKEMMPILNLTGKPGTYHLTKYFPNNTTNLVLIKYILPKSTIKEKCAMEIFSSYLTGSLSSKLFTELREKKQLIYGIESNFSSKLDNVDFEIEFNCKKNKKCVKKCIKTIDSVLSNFYKNGIPLIEFNKFKNKTIINYERDKEDSLFALVNIIKKEYFKNPETNFFSTLKKISNSYLHKSITKKLKSKETKKFIFII